MRYTEVAREGRSQRRTVRIVHISTLSLHAKGFAILGMSMSTGSGSTSAQLTLSWAVGAIGLFSEPKFDTKF